MVTATSWEPNNDVVQNNSLTLRLGPYSGYLGMLEINERSPRCAGQPKQRCRRHVTVEASARPMVAPVLIFPKRPTSHTPWRTTIIAVAALEFIYTVVKRCTCGTA